MKKGEISNDKTGISQQVDCSRGLRGTALTVKTGDSRAADRTQMGARVRAA